MRGLQVLTVLLSGIPLRAVAAARIEVKESIYLLIFALSAAWQCLRYHEVNSLCIGPVLPLILLLVVRIGLCRFLVFPLARVASQSHFSSLLPQSDGDAWWRSPRRRPLGPAGRV